MQATAVAQELDRVLLQVDVLLRGFDEDLCEDFGNDFEVVIRIEGGGSDYFELNRSLLILWLDCIPVPLPQSVTSLRTAWSKPGDHVMDNEVDPDSPGAPGAEPSTYPVVALGGTFDHLHAGHKILLSMAAWIADEKVIVGVTGMCRADGDNEETLFTEPMHR